MMERIKKYKLELGNTTKFLKTHHDNKYEWTLFVRPASGE